MLLEALAIRDGEKHFDSSSMTTVEDILYWCSSLVRRRTMYLELAHFTVKEFLECIDPAKTPSFRRYHLSGDHGILAKACINFLDCREFDGVARFRFDSPDRDEDEPPREHLYDLWQDFNNNYRFINYACLRWSQHVHNTNWDDIKNDVWNIFCTKSTFLFWTFAWRACQGDSSDIHFWVSLFDDSGNHVAPPGLHWAAMFALDKLCALFIEGGMDVSQPSLVGTPLYCVMILSYSFLKYFELHTQNKLPWLRENTGISEQVLARQSVIRQLVDAGANLDEVVDPEGQCRALTIALEIEIYSDAPFIVSTLLDTGARFTVEDFAILRKGHEYLTTKGSKGKPISPNSELCGISPSRLIKAVTRENRNVLVPGAESEFFSFILYLASTGWPIEGLRSFFEIQFSDVFSELNGSELDKIISDESQDPHSRLMRVLLNVLRVISPNIS
jgi:hypothetical protein